MYQKIFYCLWNNNENKIFICSFVLQQIAEAVNEQLDKDFTIEDGVEIVAEPGSYMVSSSSFLAVNIIGKRILSKADLYNGIVLLLMNHFLL